MSLSSRQIEERAAEWLARRDSGKWSEDDERQLHEWLEASTANAVAFIRLDAAWTQALRLKALRAGTQPGVVPPPDAWHRSPFFEHAESVASRTAPSAGSAPQMRGQASSGSDIVAPGAATPKPAKRGFPRAVAAGVLVAIAAAIGWYSSMVGPDYRTAVGGIASVPMTDGSQVTLNTDSAIRVAVTDTERRVRLDQGEAFFEVAKDPSRPFVVSAGGKRIVAVGTKFSVRRFGKNVRVLVTEGKVRFEDDSPAAASRDAIASAVSPSHNPPANPGIVLPAQPREGDAAREGSGAILLPAGSIARADESGVLIQEKPLAEVEEYLSWRSGYLIFRETSLADAVAEFNRYNEHKIVIEDPQIAALRLSGKFRSTNFEGFVRLLEGGFPIQARDAGGRIILSDAHDSAAPATAH